MILVVGTGRSGTSTVARLLHTECGVHMGTRLASRRNLGMVWEDQDFSWLHHEAAGGMVSRDEFRRRLLDLARQRTEPWGMKCPATADFLDCYIEDYPTARYVWCRRDAAAVVASWRRVRPEYPPGFAEKMAERRLRICAHYLGGRPDVLVLDFNTRQLEADLVQRLQIWLA